MTDPQRRQLAADIRAVREARKMTQEELAGALGVTGATISRWESGLSVPRPEYMRRLSMLVRPSDNVAGQFLTRYRNLPERARIEESVRRAQGVRERHQIGKYTVTLLENGGLLVELPD